MKPDTIYKKEHEHITVYLTREDDDSVINWKTVLLDNKNKTELILDEFQMKRSWNWKEMEKMGYSQLGSYTISTSFLNGNKLVVIYFNSGKVYISTYSFSEDDAAFKKETKFIQMHAQTPENEFNEVESTYLLLDDNMYLNILARKSRMESAQSFYRINLDSFLVKRIKFNDAVTILGAFELKERERSVYKNKLKDLKEYDFLSLHEKNEKKESIEKLRKTVNTQAPFIDKTFNYIQRSTDEKLYYDEHVYLHNIGLTNYNLFCQSSSNQQEFLPTDDVKMKNAGMYLSEALRRFGENEKQAGSVEIIGHVNQTQKDHFIYFFYKDSGPSIKITRYNKFRNEWLLGNYSEEAIDEEANKQFPAANTR